MSHRPARALLGAASLAAVGVFVASSIGVYNKAMPWQRTVDVSLRTSTPGLQLNARSDVKVQGLVVGSVRRVTTDGTTATVHLAIDPDKAHYVSANADAAIVPKTLFGEKFVDLRVPDDGAGGAIASGDVIRQSTTAVELGQVFRRLDPLLRTFRPDRLSVVLTALADTVDGRGDQVAQTSNLLATYTKNLDPSLETLDHDLDQFARTLTIYSKSMPDLVTLLDSSAHVSRDLLVRHEKDFADLLAASTRLGKRAESVTRENADRLATINRRGRPVLEMLDMQAVALGCMVHNLQVAGWVLDQVVGSRGPFVNITIDRISKREPYRYPDDLPSRKTSDAHNETLHAYIPSFDPHCSRISSQVAKNRDAGPYSQLLPGQSLVPQLGAAAQ